MPFLGAGAPARPEAVVLGAPYDATVTHRAGTRLAPAAIRWASQSIETYSPIQQRDLGDLAFADRGDLDLGGCPPEVMVELVRQAVAEVDGVPVVLGGEHTVTVGAVLGVADHHPDLAVVALDAHLDLRDDYEGRRWSHATTLARLAERLGPGRIAVLGARAGTRDEWARAADLAAVSRTAAFPTSAWASLAGRPLYLSVDIDALDPAEAPGTGNPEPMGLTAADLSGVLALLRGARLVGCDVVEVSPPYDPSGRTAILAAWLVREMLLGFARGQ